MPEPIVTPDEESLKGDLRVKWLSLFDTDLLLLPKVLA